MVLGQCIQQGVDPVTEDLMTHLRTKIKHEQGKASEARKGLLKAQKCLASLRGRFEVTKGENLLDGLVVGQQVAVEQELKAVTEQEEKLQRALECLACHRFRYEPTAQTVIPVYARLPMTACTAATTV